MNHHNYQQTIAPQSPSLGASSTRFANAGAVQPVTHFYITIDIQAPRDRVWAVMSDVEHWSEWTSTINSIRLLDPGPLAAGKKAVVRQPKLLPARWLVTEVEEGRSFTWTTRHPGVLVTARHSIEEVGSCSRITLSLDFSGFLGPLFARLTRGLNTSYLDIEARGLKKRAEEDARRPAPWIGRAGASR